MSTVPVLVANSFASEIEHGRLQLQLQHEKDVHVITDEEMTLGRRQRVVQVYLEKRAAGA